MGAAMPKLEFCEVSKRFASPDGNKGPLIVLDRLSLAVEEHEFVSVVGPSGCGKTTLLRMASGLIPIDDGEILLDGVPVRKPSPKASMVFQNIGLMPWKTVWGNVALGLELLSHHRLTAAERDEVAALIDLVGLRGFEDYYPYQISGGMQQRVGLARALVRKPDVLLMDEPFGALDAQTRVILQDELLHLWRERHCTVFFITHDLDEAIYLSDRVAIVSQRPGRIKQLLKVDLPRPRYGYDPRAKPEFSRLRHLAWESIKEEMSRL